MTITDSTASNLKLELSSPRLPTIDSFSTRPKSLQRSWSTGMIDDIPKRTTLPDLISTVNRLASKQVNKRHQAAIRAAASKLYHSTSASPGTNGASRPPARSPDNVTRRPILRVSPLHRTSSSASPTLASGPTLGLQQQPGTYETIEQINTRYRNTGSLPVYLIRTDLRYAPALDTVTVYMELPGLRLEDVSLKIGNRSSGIRHLVVNAVSRPPTHSRDEMAMQERVFGIFTRTLIVPPHVQANDIRAEMSNGLLVLEIPGTKFESIRIQPRH